MAFQPSAQALMSALQPKNQSKSTLVKEVSITDVEAKPSFSTSVPEISHGNSTSVIELSRALKELLVISPQKVSSTKNQSQHTECVSRQKRVTDTPANSTKSSPMLQKDRKIKLLGQKTKSRSNSEDADFYAGSAILNSPSPNAIPLPDFDEMCDFFTAESRHNCLGNVSVNLVR